MIHHLWDENRETKDRTGEKQRLWRYMVSNKSGFDIHAWGREGEQGRGAQCVPQQLRPIAA